MLVLPKEMFCCITSIELKTFGYLVWFLSERNCFICQIGRTERYISLGPISTYRANQITKQMSPITLGCSL